MINTGGEKVHPAEVEEAISELAGVEECLVTGVPDERFGQLVAAIVVAGPDRHLDASDVIAAARRSLAGYKVPRLVVFADDVPRSPNGKVDYAAAQAVLAGQLGAGMTRADQDHRGLDPLVRDAGPAPRKTVDLTIYYHYALVVNGRRPRRTQRASR